MSISVFAVLLQMMMLMVMFFIFGQDYRISGLGLSGGGGAGVDACLFEVDFGSDAGLGAGGTGGGVEFGIVEALVGFGGVTAAATFDDFGRFHF